MKVKVYPDCDSRSALEFELRPEAAVKAYLRHLDSDADVTNVCVEPLDNEARWRSVAHEVFLGKGIVLLLGGLLIGWAAGPDGRGASLRSERES